MNIVLQIATNKLNNSKYTASTTTHTDNKYLLLPLCRRVVEYVVYPPHLGNDGTKTEVVANVLQPSTELEGGRQAGGDGGGRECSKYCRFMNCIPLYSHDSRWWLVWHL